MGKTVTACVIAALLSGVVAGMTGAAGPAAAAGPPSESVTATTIRIGVPYVDLSSVRKFGIT